MTQIQKFQRLNSCQKLFRTVLNIGLFLPLLLLGCEGNKDFQELWKDLPKIGIPIQKKQPPQVLVQSAAIADIEKGVHQQINKVRQQNGLTPLRPNENLAKVARNYSKQMAVKNFFDHVSPEGSTLSQRVKSAGIVYIVVGENLFKSKNIPQPVTVAVKGWMNSPGHRKNILYPEFKETGIGVWKQGTTYYITQLFMRSYTWQ